MLANIMLAHCFAALAPPMPRKPHQCRNNTFKAVTPLTQPASRVPSTRDDRHAGPVVECPGWSRCQYGTCSLSAATACSSSRALSRVSRNNRSHVSARLPLAQDAQFSGVAINVPVRPHCVWRSCAFRAQGCADRRLGQHFRTAPCRIGSSPPPGLMVWQVTPEWPRTE